MCTSCRQSLPPLAHTPLAFSQTKAKEISEKVLNGFHFSFLHSLSSNTQTHHHSKPSRPYDLGLGLGCLHRYGPEAWVYASIKPVSLVGRIFYIDALARNLTRMTNPRTIRFSVSVNSQVWLPLSYSAQIPTTHNPDLANVRVSLSNLNQEVRTCRVCFSCGCVLCVHV